MYESHKEQILEQVRLLRKRHTDLSASIQDVERNIEVVKNAKEEKVREMRNAVELMIARLENQLKGKLMVLMNQRSKLSEETETMESMATEVEMDIRTRTKSELIMKQADVLHKCQQITSRKPPPVVVSSSCLLAGGYPNLTEFTSEIVPNYDTSTFTLQNFSRLKNKADPIYSPPLNVCTQNSLLQRRYFILRYLGNCDLFTHTEFILDES